MKKLKQEINTILQNKTFIFLLILVALGCYGFKMMHPTIGVDDTPYKLYFEDGLNIVVGRWVLFLLNQFISIGQYAPFLTDFVAVLLLMLAAILWCIVFKRILGSNLPDWCYLTFSCLFISNPIISEVFTYFLHNGIAIGYTCSALALLFYLDGLDTPKKLTPYVLSSVFIWIAIGCYESFAVVFLVMALFALLMKRICGEKPHPILSILKIGIILIVAILLRSLINNVLILIFSLQELVNQADKRSLGEMFGWISNPEGFANLKMAIKRTFVMYGVFAYHYLPITLYVFSSIIVFIGSIWKTIRRKDPWIFLYMIGIFIASWLLVLIEGSVTLYRSCQFLPLFVAAAFLLLMYLCRKLLQNPIRYVAILLVAVLLWNQTADMNKWFYINYRKYENIKETLLDVALELERHHDISKPVIFVGSYEIPMGIVQDAYVPLGTETFYKMNRITQIIDPHLLEKYYRRNNIWVVQTPALSLIGWGINAFGGNQELIHFYNMHGHNFVGVNDYDTISKAQTDYFNLPGWPKEGSIVETDEYIIVSFGNEEYQ